MNKYWSLVKVYFISAAIKRADFFGNITVNLIQIFSVIVLWLAIYNPGLTISGYTFQDTITYYVLVLLITFATTTNTADYIARSVKQGTLSEWLLRPRNIMLSELSRSFGEQIYRMLTLIPVYLILGFLAYHFHLIIGFSRIQIVLGVVFLMLGFFLNCLLEYNLAMFAFWMDEVWSIKHFKEIITDLLGGKRVPLAFLPAIVQRINFFLPFQFVYFVPLEYFLGKRTLASNAGIDLVMLLGWMLLFTFGSNLVYGFGIRRYGAYGN